MPRQSRPPTERVNSQKQTIIILLYTGLERSHDTNSSTLKQLIELMLWNCGCITYSHIFPSYTHKCTTEFVCKYKSSLYCITSHGLCMWGIDWPAEKYCGKHFEAEQWMYWRSVCFARSVSLVVKTLLWRHLLYSTVEHDDDAAAAHDDGDEDETFLTLDDIDQLLNSPVT